VEPVIASHSEDDERSQITSVASEPSADSVRPLAPRRRHPLIEGLFEELPEPHSQMTEAKRARWLRLAASMLDVLYETDADEASTADEKPSSTRIRPETE